MNSLSLLNKYPKKRPILPPKFQEIYVKHYKINREGKSPVTRLSSKLESWLHCMVAKDVASGKDNKKGQQYPSTLEIGAGTLNQLQYEEPIKGPYDIIEPFKELFSEKAELKSIRHIYSDISEIPQNTQYDRITSIATLEHVINLPELVAKSCLLLKSKGSFRVSIPSEGTLLWYLSWRLTTGVEFGLKYGLNYKTLIKHEHVNTAGEIRDVLNCFFNHIKVKYLGLSHGLSIYQYYECGDPKLEFCYEYLKQLNEQKNSH
jgi:hypothetical protein